jgi:molecular chaperone GrpE
MSKEKSKSKKVETAQKKDAANPKQDGEHLNHIANDEADIESTESEASSDEVLSNKPNDDGDIAGDGKQSKDCPQSKDCEQPAEIVESDRYLRLAAEYDNFRKRSAKEREMIYTDARAGTIVKLLPVYDNLERALKMECADEAFYKGVEMTMTQLLEIFESMDIKQIPAVGEPFDPNHHNAVMNIENPELGEKIVAEEYQKGFILGDRVIRFSTVVVAN